MYILQDMLSKKIKELIENGNGESLNEVGLNDASMLTNDEIIISVHRSTRSVYIDYISAKRYERQMGSNNYSQGFAANNASHPRSCLQKYLE